MPHFSYIIFHFTQKNTLQPFITAIFTLIFHAEAEKGGSQQQTRKRDFLMIPFLGGKKKIATSTPNISDVHGKPIKSSKLGQSTFYLDKEPSNDDVIVAKQHGLDLEMYKNEAHHTVQSMENTDSHRVTDKHIDYSYGTAVFSVSLKSGL